MFDSHDDVVALKHIGVNIAVLIGVMFTLIIVSTLI